MSHVLRLGVADQIASFQAFNDDGTIKTDLTSATAGLTISVFRVGLAEVAISSLSNKAADNTAHADGAIRYVGDSDYTIDLPDAATATQCPHIQIRGTFNGGYIKGEKHPIVVYDPATSLNSLTPAEVSQIRHRLGLDGTKATPTTTDTYLGNLNLSQLSINTAGVFNKHGINIVASGDGAFGISIDGTDTPLHFHKIGSGYFYIDLIGSQFAITDAALGAGTFLGNLGGNVWGKVIGAGSATLQGTGVRSELSEGSENSVRNGLALEATLTEMKGPGFTSANHSLVKVIESTGTIDSEMLKTGVPYTHTNNVTNETVSVTITETP